MTNQQQYEMVLAQRDKLLVAAREGLTALKALRLISEDNPSLLNELPGLHGAEMRVLEAIRACGE